VSALAYLRAHRGLVAQWFGVLGPPAAWSAQFLVSYNLADMVTCSRGGVRFLAVEDRLKPAIALVTGLSVVVAAVAGIVAYGCWRRLRDADHTPGGRAGWLAIAGIMSSVLFLILIVVGFLPLVFLPSCAQLP
jgi:hypothetical protein